MLQLCGGSSWSELYFQLFFIVSSPAPPSTCTALDLTAAGFQVYLNLARATQGEIIQVSAKAEIGPVGQRNICQYLFGFGITQ